MTVVPMLAPITIGTAWPKPSAPEATRPTMTEVLADDDCTSTVPSSPTNSPASGFWTLENRLSWVSAPRSLMPVSSDETPTRNTYTRPSTSATLANAGITPSSAGVIVVIR